MTRKLLIYQMREFFCDTWMLPSMLFILLGAFFLFLSISRPAGALAYGAGTYGACEYNTCSLTIASNGSVALDLTPVLPTTCSVSGDIVSVSTRSSTGYTMTVSAPASDTKLNGTTHGGSIVAASYAQGSPGSLVANTWGYRVDSGAFGVGPTSLLNRGNIPNWSFAGLASSVAPATIAATTAPATAEVTNVWFGACVDMNLPADTYTNNIIYSATVN